jgi:hypothetical protein
MLKDIPELKKEQTVVLSIAMNDPSKYKHFKMHMYLLTEHFFKDTTKLETLVAFKKSETE